MSGRKVFWYQFTRRVMCRVVTTIKLMSHTMNIWERVVEARSRQEVEICEQYGFMPRKSTTDAIFALGC